MMRAKQTPRFWVRLLPVVLITGLVAMGCSSSGSSDGTGSDLASPVVCFESFAEFLTTITANGPTYDYDPATDMVDLLENVDHVITGTIDQVQRRKGEEGSDRAEWVTFTSSDARVVWSQDSLEAAPTVFSASGGWPDGVGLDPIAESVSVVDVEYFAALHSFADAPGGYVASIQGFGLACVGSGDGVTSFAVPLPPDSVGLSVAELLDLLASIDGN